MKEKGEIALWLLGDGRPCVTRGVQTIYYNVHVNQNV